MPGVDCGLSLILTNSGTDLKVKNERGHTSEWTRAGLRPRLRIAGPGLQDDYSRLAVSDQHFSPAAVLGDARISTLLPNE